MVTTTKPDFAAMSGKQLVAAFNEYAGKDRKSAFQNTSEGVKACEKAYAAYLEGGTADKPTKPAAAPKKTAETPKVKAKAKAKASNGARGPRRSMDAKIVVLAAQNPRREGTFAYAHFAKMQKSKTVGDYLNKFDEGAPRRTAGQWLWNTQRDGHIRIEA